MVKRVPWLSVTPSPSASFRPRWRPCAAAARATDGAVAEETAEIERLILRGSERRWDRYLHGVVELIDVRAGDRDPAVAEAREVAIAVIANHHNLLLALPGRGARRTDTDRRRLSELIAESNEEQAT